MNDKDIFENWTKEDWHNAYEQVERQRVQSGINYNEVIDNLQKENIELKKLKFYNCKNESINGKCQCEICQYVRKLEELIPDEELRNKVMLLDDGLHEAMETRIVDLGMENIELKDWNKSYLESIEERDKACKECEQRNKNEIQDAKNFNNDLIDKCAELEKQLSIKINEEDIIDVLKEITSPLSLSGEFTIVKFELIAKQILERIGK
jgi:hypothetical protein